MTITLLQPEGLITSPAFSHVAIVPAGATTIYVGGQNGVDESGKPVSDDVAEQAAKTIDNATIALEAAGASLSDVIQWTVLIATEATWAPPTARSRRGWPVPGLHRWSPRHGLPAWAYRAR